MQIGVFHPNDPFGVMPEGRVQALVEESARQGVQLLFFNESGIDLDERTIEGNVCVNGVWSSGVYPFPPAVMNVRPWGPRRRSERELIFRKLVPFTAFLIDDKRLVTQMLAAVPELAPHLVPTALLREADQIDELLRTHDKLVIKPAQGSRGAGVQALVRSGDLYGVQQGADWRWLNRDGLIGFVGELKRDYLIQPYIVCLTPEGEPYDFRILVQRNGEGEWGISLIYPRIGGKETITSNVSVGGRTEALTDFLTRLFPGEADFFRQRLAELGLAIATFIDAQYAYPLDELGIDLAIDAQRRIWFYEANTCPGTLFYERERAVQTIAYARYVARLAAGEPERGGGAEPGSAATLGLLIGREYPTANLEAYADVARAYGIGLAYFYLEDASFRAGSIDGFRYEREGWTARTFAFPDIVYSLVDQTEADAVHELFRPSSNMLLTSREPKGPISSPLFFAVASRQRMLAEQLPRFLRPNDAESARRFVDRCGVVVMKSDASAGTEDILLLRRLNSHYEVQEANRLHSLQTAEFLAFLELFDDSNYILIERIDSRTHDGHALHIRVYVSRQPGGLWESVQIVPLLGLASAEAREALPLPADWDWLLDREFGPDAEAVDEQLRTLACAMAKQLQSANRNRLHQMVLDFALDSDRRLRLLGGEIDDHGAAVHPYDNARNVIPFALSVLESRYERARTR